MAVRIGDITTMAGVQTALKESAQGLEAIKANYVASNPEQQLKKAVDELMAKQKQLFALLGVESLEELQRRLDNIRRYMDGFKNLSGADLWNNILYPSLLEFGDDKAKLQSDFLTYMNQDVQSMADRAASSGEIANSLVDLAFQILNAHGLENKKNYRPTRKRDAFKGNDIDSIFLNLMSEEQKLRAKKFVELHEKGGHAEFDKNNKIFFTKGGGTAKATLVSKGDSLYSITKGKKGIEFDLKNEDDVKELREASKKIRKYIIEKTGIPAEEIGPSIDTVIGKKPIAFFVGDNVQNGLTGILGEIQGHFLMRYLLSDSAKKSGWKVNWAGGIYEKGKEPHDDIRIEKGGERFGIQVKNTSHNLKSLASKKIDFASREVDAYLSGLTGLNTFDQSCIEDIKSIYKMQAFNIEYQTYNKDGKTAYRAGPNNVFHSTRQEILELSRQLDLVMAMFADVLLYTASAEAIRTVETGNVLYLVGGAKFFSAAQMLSDIAAIVEQKSFKTKEKLRFSVKASTEGGTIVDLFNSQGHDFNKVKLTSAYNFNMK